MTTERIGDLPKPVAYSAKAMPRRTCRAVEHTHDRRVARTPGEYKHTCPECGESYHFTVDPASTFHLGGAVR